MAEFRIREAVEQIATRGFSTIATGYGTKLQLALLTPTLPNLPPPNCAGSFGQWRVLWLEPRRWLLVHTLADRQPPAEVQNACEPDQIRLTDVSHAMVEFVCRGPSVLKILSQGTPLDLPPERFLSGHCARTWFATFPVLIERRGTEYSLFVEAPLASAFRTWLADAASEERGDHD